MPARAGAPAPRWRPWPPSRDRSPGRSASSGFLVRGALVGARPADRRPAHADRPRERPRAVVIAIALGRPIAGVARAIALAAVAIAAWLVASVLSSGRVTDAVLIRWIARRARRTAPAPRRSGAAPGLGDGRAGGAGALGGQPAAADRRGLGVSPGSSRSPARAHPARRPGRAARRARGRRRPGCRRRDRGRLAGRRGRRRAGGAAGRPRWRRPASRALAGAVVTAVRDLPGVDRDAPAGRGRPRRARRPAGRGGDRRLGRAARVAAGRRPRPAGRRWSPRPLADLARRPRPGRARGDLAQRALDGRGAPSPGRPADRGRGRPGLRTGGFHRRPESPGVTSGVAGPPPATVRPGPLLHCPGAEPPECDRIAADARRPGSGQLDLKTIVDTIGGFFDNPIVQFALQAIAVYIVILWLAAAYWAFRDMQLRTENPILPYLAAAFIVLFTPVLFLLAVIVYRIVRPQERIGEVYERQPGRGGAPRRGRGDPELPDLPTARPRRVDHLPHLPDAPQPRLPQLRPARRPRLVAVRLVRQGLRASRAVAAVAALPLRAEPARTAPEAGPPGRGASGGPDRRRSGAVRVGRGPAASRSSSALGRRTPLPER